ncbi:MAG: hypothetical protein AMS22_06270 [Thiotrichales bacterium SG8_50]|nr:MAG: hypothetical protein AMS22_06270 [Thiotrichales bacterium SG8_50]
MTAIDVLKRKLKWITVHEACWLLKIYGVDCHSVAVAWPHAGDWYYTCPREVLKDDKSGHRLARSEKIRFFGGPPGWRQYYWGNWVQFVIDAILLAQATEDIGFKWVLEFDPMNPGYIGEQLKRNIPRSLAAKAGSV